MFEQYNHLQGEIEEHHAGVDVALDVVLRALQFVGDADDVAFVDEAGEVDSEVAFGTRHVVEFRLVEIIDEIFPDELLGVVEKILLPFASPGGKLHAPFVEVLHLAHIAEAHEKHEEVEKLCAFRIVRHLLARLDVAAC